MKKLFLLLVAISISIATYSQKSISGQILEKDTYVPIPGTTVQIKGTTIGTISNCNGEFKLQVLKDEAVLVFLSIG